VVETKSELEATTPENDLTKIDDPDIPDWLKGSLSTDNSNTPKISQTKDTNNKNDFPQKGKNNGQKNKNSKSKDNNTKNGDELWHDGMEVPDWLNTNKKNDTKSDTN
ncbi:hypothetical protein EOM39_03530, partial [Candidatus Gracilibacteria bacterium]|nr:hypothetical protein [Candidatus Gracilibacteria bacterium]